METRFTNPEAFDHQLNSSMKMRQNQAQAQKGKSGDDHETADSSSDEDTPLSLSSLSKLILPPLGVSISSCNQNHIKSKGWIISPMDSRYRYLCYVLQ